MRIALIVGINYYEHGGPLFGCVDDAHAVHAVLERHGDGSVDFDCKVLTATGPTDRVDRNVLKDHAEDLFKAPAEIALFYFAGHGHVEATGGYLLATDSRRGDEGLSLSEVLTLANASPARNKVIILDSCHSGIAGSPPATGNLASLAEGLTVLTASTADQYANEENGRGVFTTLTSIFHQAPQTPPPSPQNGRSQVSPAHRCRPGSFPGRPGGSDGGSRPLQADSQAG